MLRALPSRVSVQSSPLSPDKEDRNKMGIFSSEKRRDHFQIDREFPGLVTDP